MSDLHDVVIYLLRRGFPKSETETDELIARIEADRAPAPAAPAQESAPQYDPATGERVS